MKRPKRFLALALLTLVTFTATGCGFAYQSHYRSRGFSSHHGSHWSHGGHGGGHYYGGHGGHGGHHGGRGGGHGGRGGWR